MTGKKGFRTIVKVQLALNCDGPALIYDERREHMMQRYLEPEQLEAMGKDVKAFFEAELSKESGWVLKRRVEDKDW